MSSEENEENTPPVYVLLPICIEMITDVFHNVLKSVVLKERMQDNFHKNSMKSGMTGEKFQIDTEDLSVDWEKMTSDLRQMRQSKLLGCWAARHYPLFCKKLIGSAWQPPKKFNVQVSGSIELTDKEIDNIVSKKMELRIIELNVCKSTLDRLKYFVKAPINIGRINVTILSSKMRAFDIQSEHLAGCWQALKHGGFPSNFEQQMNSITSFKAPQPSIATSHLTIDQHRIVRRDGDQSTVEKKNSSPTRLPNAMSSSSQDIMMSPCNVLLTDIIESAAKVNVASEPTNIQTEKRARCVSPSNSTTTIMHGEPNFDESTVDKRNSSPTRLSNAMSSSSQDIMMSPCNVLLTDIIQSAAKVNVASEPTNIQTAKRARCISPSNSTTTIMHDEPNFDALRVAVFEMWEDIRNLTKSIKPNTAENDTELTNDSERFHLVVFKQKDAEISKLAESIQRLEKNNELLTNDKTKLIGEIEAKSNLISALQKVVEANSKLHGKMEEESNIMVQKMSDADKLKFVMTETNVKLQEELTAVKNRLDYFDSNFQCEKQDLLQKLSAADQLNCDLTDTNGKLREELNVAKNQSASVETRFQYQIQDLVQKLSAADQVKIELTETNGKLQEDLNAVTNHFANMESNLQCQIQDLVHKLSAADRINIELTDRNGKLQEELNASIDHSANMGSNTQCQILDFVHKLSAADQINIELTDTNGKLQQELNAAKMKLKENEKLSEILHNLKARTNNLINEFQIRVEESEKVNAQLAAENEKLRVLNIFEQNAVKGKELFQLSSLLPNRPEAHLQTERTEALDIQNGYGQAELNKENIQCVGVPDENHEEKLPEPVNGECVTVEPNGGALDDNQELPSEDEFVSDDPIVQKCRPALKRQKFGWMKFQRYQNAKFLPAFVYPADADGIERAQKIKADGYITNAKFPFWEFKFAGELPNKRKLSPEVSALKKFNHKFGFNFK